jgi:glucosyl-3-phosphoglycerate phosphatase
MPCGGSRDRRYRSFGKGPGAGAGTEGHDRGAQPGSGLTSDLKRARDTAALLGYASAQQTTGLREINVGDWTAHHIADIVERERENYRGWRAGTFAPPGGETWSDFSARTEQAVRGALDGAERVLAVLPWRR